MGMKGSHTGYESRTVFDACREIWEAAGPLQQHPMLPMSVSSRGTYRSPIARLPALTLEVSQRTQDPIRRPQIRGSESAV